jgi:choline dehydrogenase-like flavoprotein
MSFQGGKFSVEDRSADTKLEADVCIVGAGAGGSAAALALVEAGLTVVMLEEGRHWNPKDFQQKMPWALRNLYAERGVRTAMGDTIIPVAAGRGVGGSTLINSAISFRPPVNRISMWREQAGFDQNNTLFAAVERVWKAIGVSVNPPAVQKENNLIFKKGVDALGWPGHFMPRSAPGCVGCGVCQMGCPTGGKMSVDRTLLSTALATGRVAVHADCRAESVQTQGGQVTQITADQIDPQTGGTVGQVRVKAKTFVISGGAVGTPRFLLSNGLGDPKTAGKHLRFHPATGAMARFEHEIRPWEGVTQGYYVDFMEEGYLLETYTVTPDQYSMSLPTKLGLESLEIMADLSRLASSGVMASGWDSEGSVNLKGLAYTVSDADKHRLIKGLRRTAQAFFAAGANSVFVPINGTPPILSEQEIDAKIDLDCKLADLFVYCSHMMGSCRMGLDPASSVVNPTGRVWGWKNLYLADTSVFPGALGVNPQVTTMATGLMIGAGIGALA